MELIERETFYTVITLVLIIACLVVLATVKWMNPTFFKAFYKLFFSLPIDRMEALKDGTLKPVSRFLLTINLMVGLAVSAELWRQSKEINFSLLFIVPIAYVVWNYLSLLLARLVTGEYKKMKGQGINLEINYQFYGLLLIPLNLAWYLNPQYHDVFILILMITFTIIVLIRLTKGFFIGISKQVSSFYLILYLCTFEIWPLVFVFNKIQG